MIHVSPKQLIEHVDISNSTEDLNSTLSQVGLTDIYRTKENTHFLCAYKNFIKIDYISGYTRNLNKFKKSQVIWSLFSEYNGIKLEIGNKNIFEKSSNIWNVNETLINNTVSKKKSKENLEVFWTEWKQNK